MRSDIERHVNSDSRWPDLGKMYSIALMRQHRTLVHRTARRVGDKMRAIRLAGPRDLCHVLHDVPREACADVADFCAAQWMRPLDVPGNARLHRRSIEQSIQDRKSTRLNSSHRCISYAVFCLKKK